MGRSLCLLSRFARIMINFVLIILLAIYGVQGGSDSTIIAKVGEFNYFVMVWHSGEFHCGGTIIGPRHIITRGSCVIGIPSSHISIIAGTFEKTTSRTRQLQVESVHIHYGFKAIVDALLLDEINYLHDIAVLKLSNRTFWDSEMAPTVITAGNNYDRKECVVPGWRHTFIGTTKEHYYIRWNRGHIRNISYCFEAGYRLLKNEECASWPILTRIFAGSAHYYDGSPFVCGNAVIGIFDGQKRRTFHLFLNLLPYKDFIENTIDDRKYDVKPDEVNYVVSVWYEHRFKCGGIIFDASHILTTADCVQYANHARLQVIAGHTRILEHDDQRQWLLVNSIEIHPDYEEIIHFDGPKCMHALNNYALLTLAVPLEWGPTIGPASLSDTDSFSANTICGAYRWHNVYTVDDKAVLQLIWSQELVMNAEVCQEAGIGLEADEICINSQYAQHPRNFDSSGNPFVCDGFVIGIITPDYSTTPQSSPLTSILSISPFIDSLNNVCEVPPIY